MLVHSEAQKRPVRKAPVCPQSAGGGAEGRQVKTCPRPQSWGAAEKHLLATGARV